MSKYEVWVADANGSWTNVAESESFSDCENYVRCNHAGCRVRICGFKMQEEWLSYPNR